MKYFFHNRVLVAGVFSLLLLGCSNDSNNSDGSGSGDDVLRLINSLAVEGLVVTYKYPDPDPDRENQIVDRTVTLKATGGPGPETLEFVSFTEDDVFDFEASLGGVEGTALCTVALAAEEVGAADVLVFPTINLAGRDTIQIDCASNWK